jgi:hypothetical protein
VKVALNGIPLIVKDEHNRVQLLAEHDRELLSRELPIKQSTIGKGLQLIHSQATIADEQHSAAELAVPGRESSSECASYRPPDASPQDLTDKDTPVRELHDLQLAF